MIPILLILILISFFVFWGFARFIPKEQFKSSVFISIPTVILSIAFTWLVMAESSPLFEFFLHSSAAQVWMGLNIIPFGLGMAIGRAGHEPNLLVLLAGVAYQWFIIALLFLVVRNVLSRKKSMNST